MFQLARASRVGPYEARAYDADVGRLSRFEVLVLQPALDAPASTRHVLFWPAVGCTAASVQVSIRALLDGLAEEGAERSSLATRFWDVHPYGLAHPYRPSPLQAHEVVVLHDGHTVWSPVLQLLTLCQQVHLPPDVLTEWLPEATIGA